MIKQRLLRGIAIAAAVVATVASGSTVALAASPGGVQPNIIGGENATQPWAVSLQSLSTSGANHECGGVLIAPRWVMTAAHCVEYIIGGQARVGSLNWKTGGEVAAVSKTFIYPKYDVSKNFGNDLALVKLKTAVKTTPVPIGVYGPVGSSGIAQGWGITCDTDVTAPGCGDQVPDLLKQLTMTRANDHYCDLKADDGRQLNDPTSMMCLTNPLKPAGGTCFGDSGSPFLQDFFGKKAVTGIMVTIMNNTVPSPNVCSQTPDGQPNRDGATKVAVTLPWIIQTLLQNDPSAAEFVQNNVVTQ